MSHRSADSCFPWSHANKGDWGAKIAMCEKSLREIEWWIQNLTMAHNVISHGSPSLVITSDASNSGWGAVCYREKTSGHCTESEKSHYHINCLKLMASFYALKSFAKDLKNTHIQLRLDSTSVLHCINKMGSQKSEFTNSVAKQLWCWCIPRGIWVSATYIQGCLNEEADSESRNINLDGEWMLHPSLLKEAFQLLKYTPNIDLFASRINRKICLLNLTLMPLR